jgi:hypothetical protein
MQAEGLALPHVWWWYCVCLMCTFTTTRAFFTSHQAITKKSACTMPLDIAFPFALCFALLCFALLCFALLCFVTLCLLKIIYYLYFYK